MIREATTADESFVASVFLAMISELAQFGHDIAPTKENAAQFWEILFGPAIQSGRHGVMIDDEHSAAVFMVPETSRVITPTCKRIIDWGCYVPPAHRRNGIGTNLRQSAMTRLQALGYKKVSSSVMVQNLAGLESYRKIGAKIVGYMTEVEI